MSTIRVTNLGKAYKIYPSRWSRLIEWIAPFLGVKHSLKWVLRDINFVVSPGKSVGIIGINGAGKSTLLKLITGTSHPTTGSIEVSGRVTALLELGMGFHPDFTGRQNVYMASQLFGYSAKEIDDLMPEIEQFSGIGSYIDHPVRVYSSGMQMRLAFSIATARRPDILIIDEALSVGDALFQHKCFERIKEFRRQGTTLLFVSHDKATIQSICDSAILLNDGVIALEGTPEAVMDYYNALLAGHQNQTIRQDIRPDGTIQTTSGTGEARVTKIELRNENNLPIEVVHVGQNITLHIEVEILDKIDRLILGFGIKDRLGLVMYGTNTDLLERPILSTQKGDVFKFDFSFSANLGIGTYSIQTSLSSTDTHLVNNYEWIDMAIVFSMINTKHAKFAGCTWIEPMLSVKKA